MRRVLTERETLWAISKHKVGYTLEEIAEKFDCDVRTIRRAFNRHGYSARYGRRRPPL